MSRFFDESHIRQILQAINIVDIISNYVALKPRGKEMVGLCPFHTDHRPSFNVNETKQIFKCFACGTGGDVIKFIMLREQMTYPEAVRYLAEMAGIELPSKPTGQKNEVDRNELCALNQWVARFFRSQYDDPDVGQIARDYIANRSIEEAVARRFGIGLAPKGWDNLYLQARKDGRSANQMALLGLLIEKEQGGYYDRFRERLMFPVIDALGRIIGFGGRTLGDDPAKYMNSPESPLFNKSRTMYGLHAAKDSIVKERMAIIVEGYTDCIMAHQHGLTNVVATLGTALTKEHAQLLSRYADRIIVVFDSDAAGQKAADRAIEVFFAQNMQVKLVSLPQGQDPCDFLTEQGANGKEAFMELVANATDALEYKWQVMEQRLLKADTVSGHKQAVDEYLELMATLMIQENMDQISQGFLLNRVAKMVNVPVEQVHQRVHDNVRKMQYRKRNQKSEAVSTTAVQNKKIDYDPIVRRQTEVLEVLLNRPELLEKVKPTISKPDQFKNPVLQQIARRVWACVESNPQCNLAEILAGCESVELCKEITELADRGDERGNLETTLDAALVSLQGLEDDLSRQSLRAMIAEAKEKYGEDAQAAMLLELQAKHKPSPRGGRALFRN